MFNRFTTILLLLGLFLGSLSFASSKDHDSKKSGVEYYGSFIEADLSAVYPKGWLEEYLNRQANGLTGNLEVAGFPFNSTGWYDTTMAKDGWVVYEQNAYWVDGMLRCGELINDTVLINKALKQINYMLENADTDGYLGPEFLKAKSNLNRWPHVVFFRALIADYEKTHDPKIPKALLKHYLSKTDPYVSHRNIINVEIILWTYSITKDRRLLKMAEDCYDEYNKISNEITTLSRMKSDYLEYNFHGVTFNETAKLASILYLYTGKKEYLEAVENAYNKVDENYMLVDGVNSSTEGMRGNDPLESHETCDIADYTWSIGYLLMATGNPKYADKIERACFNAAPGAVTKDFKALQYFSCPNQVIADRTSNHNLFFHGSEWMSYRPNPGTACCAGNVNRIMPNYVSRMWMKNNSGGPIAAFYGPSEFTFNVGDEFVKITEQTDYPFSEEIQFTVHTKNPVSFSFTFRVPSWCDNPEIIVKSKTETKSIKSKPGSYQTLERIFNDGDTIFLKLPMHLKVSAWPTGGVAIERGPLVYSLDIPAETTIDTLDKNSSKEFPAYNMTPAAPWNYTLVIPDKNLDKYIEVVNKPNQGYFLDPGNAPLVLKVEGKKVYGWNLQKDDFNKESLYTPPLPNRNTFSERISDSVYSLTLVPYGSTLLRQTIFPLVGNFTNVTGRIAEPVCLVKNIAAKDSSMITLKSELPDAMIYYTLDESEPSKKSNLYTKPFILKHSATLKAKAFSSNYEPSYTTKKKLYVVYEMEAVDKITANQGLAYEYYEGDWKMLPDFKSLKSIQSGSAKNCSLDLFPHRDIKYGADFNGFIDVPDDGIYHFYLSCDDGGKLLINNQIIIDNDGLHALQEKDGYAWLKSGKHKFQLQYFQRNNTADLMLEVTKPDGEKQTVPNGWFYHD